MGNDEGGPGTGLVAQTVPAAGGELDNKRLNGGLASGNGVISPERWQMLAAIAETVYKTAFVPSGLRGNAPSTLACLLYGDAQGLHPMVALKEISVIDGTPTESAALMAAQVRSAGKGHRLKRVELRAPDGTFLGCKAIGTRGDDGETDEYAFTLEMAARAGLLTKTNWKHYPEAMCWHRAASQLCTFLFPDVFMGSPYVPEELGAAETGADGRLDGQEPTAASAAGAEPEDEPMPAIATSTGIEELRQKVASGDDLSDEELHIAASLGLIRDGLPVIEQPPAADLDEVERIAEATIPGPPEEEPSREEFLATVKAEADAEAEQRALAIEKDGETVRYGKQTIPLILSFAATAPAEWLEGYLAYERAHKNRARLIAELEANLAKRRAAAPAGENEPAVPSPPTVDPTAAGAAGSMVVEHETLGPEQTETFLPADESESPEKRALLTKLKAAIAWLNDQQPAAREWRLEAVIASASRIWKMPVHSLEELSPVELEQIWAAVPEEAKQGLALIDAASLEKLAEAVPVV